MGELSFGANLQLIHKARQRPSIYEEPENAPPACGGDESVIALGFPKGAQHPFGQGWGECPTREGEACSAWFALPPSLLPARTQLVQLNPPKYLSVVLTLASAYSGLQTNE